MRTPDALRQIHQIMEAISEEERGLSAEQRLTNLKSEAQRFLIERNLDLRRASQPAVKKDSQTVDVERRNLG